MKIRRKFQNHYEVLKINPNATIREIRQAHTHAIAHCRDSGSREKCNTALAVLQDPARRQTFHLELTQWNREQLTSGKTEIDNAAQSIQSAKNNLDSAKRNVKAAKEILFDKKHTGRRNLLNARTRIHELCQSAINISEQVNSNCETIIVKCEAAGFYLDGIRFLMEDDARILATQLRVVDREVRLAKDQALDVIHQSNDLETEIDELVSLGRENEKSFFEHIKNFFENIGNMIQWLREFIDSIMSILRNIGNILVIAFFVGVAFIIIIIFVVIIVAIIGNR